MQSISALRQQHLQVWIHDYNAEIGQSVALLIYRSFQTTVFRAQNWLEASQSDSQTQSKVQFINNSLDNISAELS